MAIKTVYPFGTEGQLPSSIAIINDLATGGADKALSAQMGKVLHEEHYDATNVTSFPTTDKYIVYGVSGGATTPGYIAGSAGQNVSDYWSLDGVERINYKLKPNGANCAVVGFWNAAKRAIVVDDHIVGVGGSSAVQSGTIDAIDFPEGAAYVRFCTAASYADTSVQLLKKKYALESDFAPVQEEVLGVDTTPKLGDGTPNNGGNSYQIRNDSPIYVTKGDVVTVTFKRPLETGYSYNYTFAGSSSDIYFTDLSAPATGVSSVKTEGSSDNQKSNQYIITSDDTICVCVSVLLRDASNNSISMQPYTDFSVGDLVVNVKKPTSISARLESAEKSIAVMEPQMDTLLGDSYTPTIANGTPNNSGNAYEIRNNSLIPAKKGDAISITFLPEPDTGCHYRYTFVGSDTTSIYTGLNTHRTENVTQDSSRYIIQSSNTVAINVSVKMVNAQGTQVTLQPANQYHVGDLVVNVADQSTHEGRITALEAGGSDSLAFDRNKERAIALDAACRMRKKSETFKDFQFLIVTDSHADTRAVRNAVQMVNGFKAIDAMIHLGDMEGAYMVPTDNMTEFISAENDCQKPYFNVVGNHEAGTYNFVGAVPSQAHMYDVLIAPMVENGYLESSEYTANKCYYYHDFTDHNLRLIVLNEFDGTLEFDEEYWTPVTYDSSKPSMAWSTSYAVGDIIRIAVDGFSYTDYCFKCVKAATTGTNAGHLSGQEPKYAYGPKNRFISQTQAQWFVDTLLSTPANYGVVIAMHQVFSDYTTTQTDKKFCQDISSTGANSSENLLETDFIADAVNAFINGTDYTQTVDYTVAGSSRNYTVAANFTQKNTGVKFMCYLGGHTHKDLIWKHDTYNNQWMVAPVCSNANSYAQCPGCDIRRSSTDGIDYDCLTAVAFNLDDRNIALTKLGVNVTDRMTPRDYERLSLDVSS